MFEIRHYIAGDGRDPFAEWRAQLGDNRAKIAVDRRLYRVALGNFGDHKPCGDGVWELRIDAGPGYRVYYARAGQVVVLLLCGGNKRSQDADIAQACDHWQDWRRNHTKQEKAR